MMNRIDLARALIAPAALVAAQADATVYTGVRTIGAGTATLSITTDGTIGVLKKDNITGWTIDLVQGVANVSMTDANSRLLVFGDRFRATATSLTFDFSRSDGADMVMFSTLNSTYCLEALGCYEEGGESMSTTGFLSTVFEPRAGVQVIANAAAAAVPEPTSWGLMVMGFGLAGLGLRRRTIARRAA